MRVSDRRSRYEIPPLSQPLVTGECARCTVISGGLDYVTRLCAVSQYKSVSHASINLIARPPHGYSRENACWCILVLSLFSTPVTLSTPRRQHIRRVWATASDLISEKLPRLEHGVWHARVAPLVLRVRGLHEERWVRFARVEELQVIASLSRHDTRECGCRQPLARRPAGWSQAPPPGQPHHQPAGTRRLMCLLSSSAWLYTWMRSNEMTLSGSPRLPISCFVVLQSDKNCVPCSACGRKSGQRFQRLLTAAFVLSGGACGLA
jgi:hypothetical protein